MADSITKASNFISFTQSSFPSYLTNVNGTLYFTAFDSTTGANLWRINSSDNGEQASNIIPLTQALDVTNLTNVNGILYFSFRGFSNERWRINSSGNPVRVNPVLRRGDSSNYDSFAVSVANVNGTVYFTSRDGTTGVELWRINSRWSLQTGAGHLLNHFLELGLPTNLSNLLDYLWLYRSPYGN